MIISYVEYTKNLCAVSRHIMLWNSHITTRKIAISELECVSINIFMLHFRSKKKCMLEISVLKLIENHLKYWLQNFKISYYEYVGNFEANASSKY